MVKVITLFNPTEKPYGSLSNNYRHSMVLDGQTWISVTNYIYASLLTTPAYKTIVRLAKPKDVKGLFHHYYAQSVSDVTRQALDEALKVKFANTQLSELLTSTGNRPLVYLSPNRLLGAGHDGTGTNLVGKLLAQLRYQLVVSFKKERREQEKKERESAIYDAYLADKLLTMLLKEGNDLSDYRGLTVEEMVKKYGRDKIERIAAEKGAVLVMFNRGQLDPSIEFGTQNPDMLILNVKKKHLAGVRPLLKHKRREIVLDMYLNHMLKKNYKDLDVEDYPRAKSQHLDKLSWDEQQTLMDRVYNLFELGRLSPKLSDRINERLATIWIPSETDIAEVAAAPVTYREKPRARDVPYSRENGEPVYFSAIPGNPQADPAYDSFSLLAYTGMLRIGAASFPTVAHYIIAKRLAALPSIGGMAKAYPYLLVNPSQPATGPESFLSADSASAEYEKLRDTGYAEDLRANARTALDKKFTDRTLQDVLLLTGDATLVWGDWSDAILGSGPEGVKGNNFVGKYLMTIRARINEERKGEKVSLLTTEDVSSILNNDMFLRAWLEMRIKDMCRVVNTVRNYVFSRDGTDQGLTSEFVEAVLDLVYQPCSHLFGMAADVRAPPPRAVRHMVQSCAGFQQAGFEIVDLIWRRIAVMVYFLVKHMDKSSLQNVRAVIAGVEELLSRKMGCTAVIEDEADNCIVSALVNLLKGLSAFNKRYSTNWGISEVDVRTAASIIVNSDIGDEIKEDVPLQEDIVFGEAELEVEEGDDDEANQWADYGDEPDEPDGDEESPLDLTSLVNVLASEFDAIDDPGTLANLIMSAAATIKAFPMSKKVKQNRINFFASLER